MLGAERHHAASPAGQMRDMVAKLHGEVSAPDHDGLGCPVVTDGTTVLLRHLPPSPNEHSRRRAAAPLPCALHASDGRRLRRSRSPGRLLCFPPTTCPLDPRCADASRQRDGGYWPRADRLLSSARQRGADAQVGTHPGRFRPNLLKKSPSRSQLLVRAGLAITIVGDFNALFVPWSNQNTRPVRMRAFFNTIDPLRTSAA